MSEVKVYTNTSDGYIDNMLFDMGGMTKMFICSIALTVLKVTTPNGLDADYFSPGLAAEDSNAIGFFRSRNYLNYATHGHMNLWWSQVLFLHRVSKELSENRLIMDTAEVKLLIYALNSVHNWKADFRAREIAIHGEHWGSATGFTQFNPIEHLAKLHYKYNIPLEK